MESKKTFGEYIRQRRKELGLTQREFADRLYVTESAVSKWERGMSYPDVTLLRDICAVLEITEHELLTASEDTDKRSAERLAAKYLRLTRTYRIALYIIFGGILIGCGIGSLAGRSRGDWFPIALSAVLLAASLTLAPSLAARRQALDPYKWPIAAGCGMLSLELLLLCCCLYSGGSWFPMACAMTLFAGGLLLLPVILPQLPLPEPLARRKASLYLGTETLLLLLLLLVGCVQYGDDFWFPVAAVAVIFGTGFLFLPVYLRQLPLPEPLCRCKLSLYTGIQAVLLLLLLLACCLYTGGSWFGMAAVSVVFGLGIVFLPIPLWQLPLPETARRHKALLYLGIETVLLFALLGMAEYWSGGGWLFTLGVPAALVGLTLPWGLLGLLRYLPAGRWYRASLGLLWADLWLWLYPWMADKIAILNGAALSSAYTLRIPCDFSRWDIRYTGWNIFALVLLGLALLAAGCAAAGVVWSRREKEKR